MATEIRGTSDPARTIATLWRTRQLPQRGPKHTLTIAQLIGAAIEIADADQDLATLSMRRVAESLGVGTMSLYTYVASRDELVDAMLDTVYGESIQQYGEAIPQYGEAIHRSGTREGADWRDGLREVAHVNWDLYMRHPWVLQVFTGRPPLGPHEIAKYERELSVIDGIGLTDVEMDAVITLVHTHVEGVARRRLEADLAVRRTGITDQQWWETVQPAIAEVFDPSQFPLAARVGQATGQAHQAPHSPEHAYTFGLERLLQGVEALIDERTRTSA
ncbi:TetR/AcrR family transcriptional regulator [Actinobacteria bacterium YIM 96077]|uniref:TetR/AcrR family transcriptional regulator n=1 Tax=Phytoactinopolyspora halophila TaxID=1981511 RepID=A0A329QHA5_9ACTN|nr:TetR/AcrR family transcriptional regulator C-terminal domain-containing protein [Phytoactinopolyspora halophila]AYY13097.1 TetR/AcrR family transcriptional regulator [Actinobacteria bacterium YIM 96077]RAW11109.1 TetR/AcrR family transcriptional regulator [Phytoactinopolyspora halophila]